MKVPNLREAEVNGGDGVDARTSPGLSNVMAKETPDYITGSNTQQEFEGSNPNFGTLGGKGKN